MTPDEMLAKAAECEQKARATHDAGVVRMYKELAAQWRELAEQSAAYDKPNSSVIS